MRLDARCGGAAVALLALVLGACSGPQVVPTNVATVVPTPAATATFRPAVPATQVPPTALPATSAQAAPTVDIANTDPVDVEVGFLSNVDDVIAEAADLAVTPCEDLTVITKDNPNLMPSLRGFAAALKRVGTSQAVLDTDAVKNALSDLDSSMGQLEGALSVCGISQR
ncbi:MAG TPA: hypothetical protein VGQ62_06810 [Chloroflexota bacterium]|nr:hypothetical protein [Chloroflexota bacterium]